MRGSHAARFRARIFLAAGILDVALGAGFLLWGHQLFPGDAAPVLGLRLEQLIGICLVAAALAPLAIFAHESRKLEAARRPAERESAEKP